VNFARRPLGRLQAPQLGLSRRDFLAGLIGFGAGTGVATWWSARPTGEPLSPLPIADWAPQLDAAVARGDQRPATYLLQEAGERVLASLLARLDRTAKYRPYFALDMSGPEPVLRHDVWDWIDMSGRMVDAFARLRLLTGSASGQEEEAAVRALLLDQQRADGLFWNGPSATNDGYGSEVVEIFSQSRALLALATCYALSGRAWLEDAI